MKIKVSDADQIRSYIGAAPIIVNGKCNDLTRKLTRELCERYFGIEFLEISAIELVEKYILPSIRLKKLEVPGLIDNHKHGVILREYKQIRCRAYTSAFLLSLLKREFAIIILDDAGTDFPHDGGAVYIDQWEEKFENGIPCYY